MADFLQMDLEYEEQPATIRLNDTITTILQAYFNVDGAIITRFGISGKHEQFQMATREIQELCAAWTDYQARLTQHAIDIAEHKKATVAKAKELAKSVHFDLPGLNVRGILNNNGWKVLVPAIGFECHASTADDLLQTVQEALDKIKRDVEHAEKSGWCGDWNEIIASYRRAFPLNPLASEPIQIIQARALLTEAGVDGWVLNLDRDHPEKWILHGGFGQNDELVMHVEPPAQILTIVKAHMERKQMTEQGEPSEITEARELLKNSLHPADWAVCAMYPGTTIDCWSFDNGQEGDKHYAMLNHPASKILEFVKMYIAEEQAPATTGA